LKKESLLDKVNMQENFIEELENRGNANINANKQKVSNLSEEIEQHLGENTSLEEPLYEYITRAR
jgi:RNase adaptor protein for sRNA GlmZ degradation